MPTENRKWVYDNVSMRDAEVACRCAEDMTVTEIAGELGIGESTVYDHISSVAATIGGAEKRDVARWWRAEKDNYHARLHERLLLDDAG